jgi:hypothetical protein
MSELSGKYGSDKICKDPSDKYFTQSMAYDMVYFYLLHSMADFYIRFKKA